VAGAAMTVAASEFVAAIATLKNVYRRTLETFLQ
jgi:hypothetical protein